MLWDLRFSARAFAFIIDDSLRTFNRSLKPVASLFHTIAPNPAMESLLYKTPSPVTAKRRLSSIPISRIGLGREQRVASDHIQRIQTDWPELQKERTRRGSMGNTGHFTRQIKDDADSIDSSMGFRELERVRFLDH